VYSDLSIISIKEISIPALIVFLIYSIKLVIDPTSNMIFRIVAFPVSFVFGVMILPYYVNVEKFTYILSRTAIILLTAGLLGLLFSFDPFLWRASVPLLPRISITVPIIKSIFNNPQTLGFLCLAGILSSLYLLIRKGEATEALVILFLTYGMWITEHRAALLAIVLIGIFMTSYNYFGKFGIVTFLVVGTIGFIIGLLMIFDILPGLTGISLGGRKQLWYMSYEKFLQKPILGYGPIQTSNIIGFPPHSILFRMLITGGLFGSLAYFWIFGYIFINIPLSIKPHELVIFAGLLALLITDLFSGNSIFGFSHMSIVMTLFLGYASLTLIPDN
jgi:hypothetical protein